MRTHFVTQIDEYGWHWEIGLFVCLLTFDVCFDDDVHRAFLIHLCRVIISCVCAINQMEFCWYIINIQMLMAMDANERNLMCMENRPLFFTSFHFILDRHFWWESNVYMHYAGAAELRTCFYLRVCTWFTLFFFFSNSWITQHNGNVRCQWSDLNVKRFLGARHGTFALFSYWYWWTQTV